MGCFWHGFSQASSARTASETGPFYLSFLCLPMVTLSFLCVAGMRILRSGRHIARPIDGACLLVAGGGGAMIHRLLLVRGGAHCEGRSLAQVTLLCSIASIAGGEYVEKIAQIRLHNDTTSKCFADVRLRCP